jgi:RNA polymerase sigma factor FliA
MEPRLDQPEAEACLWQRFRGAGDAAARARLLEMHLPYAKILAGVYFGRRYHDEVEFGDYLQLASIGLVEALDRFDPARGVQFRTFAARRMHGAILNGLERMTEKQQQIAVRQRLRNERLHEVKAIAGQVIVPGPAQDPEQLVRFVTEVGIGLALCWMLEGTGMVESAEGCVEPFYRSVAMRQLRDRLLHAVDSLPPHERIVIRSHYLQDVPFDRIAETLGLTKGRISQIHKQALLRLRALVREDADWNASL